MENAEHETERDCAESSVLKRFVANITEDETAAESQTAVAVVTLVNGGVQAVEPAVLNVD